MNTKLKYALIALGIILIAQLRLVLLDFANFAPIAAAGIFGHYFFNNKKAPILLAILALFISDLLIQTTQGFGLYPTRIADYFALFIALLFAGFFLQHLGKKLSHSILAAGIGSLIFFLISNSAVWLFGNMYSHNISGYFQALEMGIPFYRGTLLGDMVFTTLFVGLGHLIQEYLAISPKTFKSTN